MREKLIIILSIIGLAFLSNLLWENLQAPLFTSYIAFEQHLSICTFATLGDVVIVIALYLFIALLHKNLLWVKGITKSDLAILALLGALIAIGIEKWALNTERWRYTSSMPIVPYLDVGLSPLLQMMVLPLLTIYLAKLIINKYRAKEG